MTLFATLGFSFLIIVLAIAAMSIGVMAGPPADQGQLRWTQQRRLRTVQRQLRKQVGCGRSRTENRTKFVMTGIGELPRELT